LIVAVILSLTVRECWHFTLSTLAVSFQFIIMTSPAVQQMTKNLTSVIGYSLITSETLSKNSKTYTFITPVQQQKFVYYSKISF